MNAAQRYEKAVAIFHEACDLSAVELEAFLAKSCGTDEDLRRAVDLLLQHDSNPCDAVEAGEQGEGLRALSAASPSDETSTPRRIGQYQIVRRIGQGGMGIVFEAEQEHPRRTVALKVLNVGIGAVSLLKRFQREADFLGRLQHPGIAQIFEAGVGEIETPSGIFGQQPFIAMELIDGMPLGQWVRAEERPVAQRLEILIQICDAVEHAHQRGVVHRDLKPGNILVDAGGHPKILDFGIARVIESEAELMTLQTKTGQLLGTVPYMSPEQVTGDTRIVDVRTDVYALGVLLYEMLSGRLPFDLRHRSIAEAARVIREDEPTRLSELNKSLRGDLETIVSKALEKDPERRYSSTGALAADLRRFLADEPILARPSSTLYQIQKFARRNKTLVGGVAATMLALFIGLSFALYGFVSASRERDTARSQQEASEAVTSFLSEMLAAVDPEQRGLDVKVRDVLNRAEAGIGDRFAQQPLVEARLQYTIGKTYVALSEYDKGEPHLLRAVELWDTRLGDSDTRTLDARSALGEVLYYQGSYERAEKEFKRAHEGYRLVLKPGDPRLISSASDVAFIAMQLGRYTDAEKLFLEAQAIQRKDVSDDDPIALELRSNLGALYIRMGQFEKAESIFLDVIDRSRRIRGPDHPETVLAMANLASTYLFWKRPADAAPLLKQALEIQTRVLGENHSKTLITLHNLARALQQQDKYLEAEPLLRDGLERARTTYGDAGRSTILFVETLATNCQMMKKLNEADRLLNDSLRLNRKVFGNDAQSSLIAQRQLIEFYIDQSRFKEATPLAEDLVQLRDPPKNITSSERCRWKVNLARCYTETERFAEAERILKDVHESAPASDNLHTVEALARLYDRWGRPEDARHWRAETQPAVANTDSE